MSRPNIVFIMADDTGYGDVSCYNADSKILTPHIDRLAAEGTMFTDAHSPCALCTPTRSPAAAHGPRITTTWPSRRGGTSL